MAETLDVLLEKIKNLEETVENHDQDLYRGNMNGKPGITSRILTNEKDIETVNNIVKEIKNDLRKVVWFVLAAVLAEILKVILVKV